MEESQEQGQLETALLDHMNDISTQTSTWNINKSQIEHSANVISVAIRICSI